MSSIMNRGNWRSSPTIDCCTALFHRVGGRRFFHSEVKDLVPNPAQLKAMANRGYVKAVGKELITYENCGLKYPITVWQMTESTIALVEVQEGQRA